MVTGENAADRISDLVAPTLKATDPDWTVADGLLDFGLSSLAVIELVGRIEREFGVRIAPVVFTDNPSIEQICAIIDAGEPAAEAAQPPQGTRGQEQTSAATGGWFGLTRQQQAYCAGRGSDLELGNVSTHGYLEFDGRAFDLERFGTCWNRLVARHDQLRTVIDVAAMRARVLDPPPPYQPRVVDLRGHTGAEVDTALCAVREELSGEVRAADRWPLFEWVVSLLDDDRFRLHLSIDALICDYHSLRVLLDELSILYAEPTTALPELGITFREYLAAVEAAQDSPAAQDSRRYWEERAADLPGPPELPLTTAAHDVQVPSFRRREHRFAPETTQRLHAVAKARGHTVPAVVLAAYAEILGRWSSSEHFVLNLPIINRRPVHPDAERLVGEFASFLLVEVDHRAAATFGERAQQIARQLWSDLAHSEVEGMYVIHRLMRTRGFDSAFAPVVFNGLSALPERPGAPTGFLAGTAEQTYRITQTPQTWLDCQLEERDGCLILGWDHVHELLAPDLVADMFDTFIDLVTALASDDRWSEADPLRLPAHHAMSRGAIEGAVRDFDWCDLLDGFRARIAEQPEATALGYPGGTCTYRELADDVVAVAYELSRSGIGTGDRVAVLAARAPRVISVQLAVLCLGAVYVPLDPAEPAERLDAVLARCAPALVVAIGSPPAAIDAGLVLEPLPRPAPAPNAVLPVAAAAAEVAAVIFTSGSTGVPKGVEITRAGLANALQHTIDEFGLGPADRVLAVTGPHHDMALFDSLGTLSAGATIVLAPSAGHADPRAWARLTAKHQVTVWNSVPAAMEMLTGAATDDQLGTLRLAFLGGDWIPVPLVRELRRRVPGLALVSVGGPTETTLWNIHHRIGDPAPEAGSVPYGLPIANCAYHVLDTRLRPCPDGTAGELWCSGAGLARGYLGDAESTRRAFVTDPVTTRRMYRTGDRGLVGPDGVIRFLGRIDQQLAIRGHRVEPAEIETVAAGHPAVRRCVAVGIPADDGPGYRDIALFLVTGDPADAAGIAEEVIAHCRERLPRYARPAVVEVLADLPLTANGKVDRRDLERRAAARRERGSAAPDTAPPVDGLVAELCATLATALGTDRIAATDSFFESGGNSLVAARFVADMRSRLGVSVELRDIFTHPTPGELARILRLRRLEHGDLGAADDIEIACRPADRHEWFDLTHQQQAYVVGRLGDFELGSGATHAYVEFEAFDLDIERFTAAWNALVRRHDMLRAVVSLERNQQRVLESVPGIDIEVIDLRGHEPPAVAAAHRALRDRLGAQVRDPMVWPLYEIAITQLDEHRSHVHLSIDALIYDHRSWGVLVPELQALHQDPDHALPPLRLTFRDYVLGLETLTGTERYRASAQYWRQRIATLAPAPELPLAVAPGEVTDPTFERMEHQLSPRRWHALRATAAERGLSPSGLLLAAYAEILGRWSGAAEFTLNLPYAGRLPIHPEVDSIVGQLSSVILVEINRGAGDTFAERAVAAQHRLWEDLSHPWYPGVEVLRDLMRRLQVHDRPVMPVVMTSALALGSGADADTGFLHPIGGITQTPQVWLDFQVNEDRGALRLDWDHVVELFPPGLVADMFAAFVQLLEGLADGVYWDERHPDILPATSGARNGAGTGPALRAPAEDVSVLLARQAATRPDQIAVDDGAGTLTFAELHTEASRVAAALLAARAAGPPQPVGILLPPGRRQVIAVHAALLAGLAYLPLDRELPTRRLAEVCAQTGMNLVLTSSDTVEHARHCGTDIVDIDTVGPRAAHDIGVLPSPAAPGPAYVIMTSGSTGTPKGATVGRDALAHFVATVRDDELLDTADRVLMVTALHHDLSVFHTVAAPALGATVVIAPEHGYRSPDEWARLVAEAGITVWMTVPAMMQMLLDTVPAGYRPPVLRRVILGGDWFPIPLLRQIRSIAPAAEVVSIGGPTETTVWNITHRCAEVSATALSVPYGRPTAHNRYTVLDECGAECPDWVTGELFCGGANLGDGYWNDRERTDAVFGPDADGRRAYRSGDRGRFVPDGAGWSHLEFRGRIDHQITVRGHRIETGEIEHALTTAVPGVRAAVVVGIGYDDAPGLRGLAAFTVLEAVAGQVPTPAQIRDRLAAVLAAHLLPDRIEAVEALPLTPNGKVDRRVLAERARAVRTTDPKDRPTETTPLVSALTSIFSEVLDGVDVGPEDDFFDLGGNSLTANRVVVAVREVFPGLAIAIPDVLTARTVRDLAAIVANRFESAHRIAELYLLVAGMDDEELHNAIEKRELI